MARKKKQRPAPAASQQAPLPDRKSRWAVLRDNVLRWGPVVLWGVTPLVFLRAAGEFDNNPKMIFLQSGIALLGIVALLRPGAGGWRWRRCALDVPIALFYATALASLLQAANPALAVLYLLHWAAVIVFYVFLRHTQTHTNYVAMFVAVTLSAGVVSLIGILQYLRLPGLDLHTLIPQLVAPASTFSNKNMAAQFVALTVPLGIAAAVLTRRIVLRSALAGSLGICMLYLLCAETRSAWVCMLATAALGGAVVWRTPELSRQARPFLKSRQFGLLCAVLAVVVLVGGAMAVRKNPQLPGQLAERFTSLLDAKSGTGKLRIIWRQNTLAMVRDHFWAGVGLGNFKIEYPRYHRAVGLDWSFSESKQLNRVHFDHLQMLAELGLFGLCAYLSMFVTFFYLFLKAFRRDSARDKLLTLAAGLCVVNFLIIGALSFPWERAMPPLFVFTAFALAADLARGTDAPREIQVPAGGLSQLLRAAGVCALAGFAVMSLTVLRNVMQSDKYFVAGLMLNEKKQYARSTAALQKAKSYFPAWNFNVPTLIARNYISMGKYRKALAEYAFALQVHPNNINALINAGYCHLQLHQYDQAEKSFLQFLEIMPESAKGYNNLGIAYFNRREYDRALDQYRRALELEPDYGEPYFNMANIYRQQGRQADALKHYELALEANPDMTSVRKLLVNVYLQTGNYDRAEALIAPLRENQATAVTAHQLSGLVHQRQNQHEAALQEFVQGLRLDPDNADLLYNIGLSCYYLQRYEKAEQAFTAALANKPDHAEALLHLGQLLLRRGQDQQALACFQKAAAANPALRDAHYNLGTVALRLGHLDQAVDAYEQTLKIDPDFGLAHYNLATILRHQGKYRQALEHFELSMQNPSRLMDLQQVNAFIAEMKSKL